MSQQVLRRERAREGSPWTGMWAVVAKEMADNLTSVRMHILELLIALTAVGAVYGAIQEIMNTIGEDRFLYLKLFTEARSPMPAFVGFLGFLVPLIAIAMSFDTVNGEFNRRTMSRILAQPIYRDALLFGILLSLLLGKRFSTFGVEHLANSDGRSNASHFRQSYAKLCLPDSIVYQPISSSEQSHMPRTSELTSEVEPLSVQHYVINYFSNPSDGKCPISVRYAGKRVPVIHPKRKRRTGIILYIASIRNLHEFRHLLARNP